MTSAIGGKTGIPGTGIPGISAQENESNIIRSRMNKDLKQYYSMFDKLRFIRKIRLYHILIRL